MGPRLVELSKRRPDIAVRELDFDRTGHEGIDFDSPLARQYGVSSAPYFIVFAPGGRIIGKGRRAFEQVMKELQMQEL